MLNKDKVTPVADPTPDAPKVADLLAPDERVDARTLAAMIGDPKGAHRWALAREVNDKRVRSVARDEITRFVERTGYTAHAYTQDEADAIVAFMAGRGRGASVGPNVTALRERAAAKDGAA